MKGLGWNPELVGPLWPHLARLTFGSAYLGGEAALAGYWLHHRMVGHIEILAPEPQALEDLRAQLGGTTGLELPGMIRLQLEGTELDLLLESSPHLEPGPPESIPPQSLRDLAADRWLRLFSPSPSLLSLVDLFFLQRARVDLELASRDMSAKDLGASRRALAVVLHELTIGALPAGLVRPVTREDLEEFRLDWAAQLGLETFS